MASLRMRTVLVLLGLLFPVPQSFVIRRRSVAGYDAAVKNSKSVFSDRWLPAAVLDPYSRGPYLTGDPDRLALDLMAPSDDHYLNDLKDEDEDEDERRLDGEYRTDLIPDEGDGEGEVDGDGTKLLNKSELENLFENDADREKKLMSVARMSELTRDDVEKMLGPEPSPSRGDARRKMVTETEILVGASSSTNGTGARPSYEGVRVVEVTEQQPNGETRKQKQTDWLRSPDSKQQADAPDNLVGAWSVGGSSDGVEPEGAAADQQRVRYKVKRSELSATEEDDDDDKGLDKEQGISDADDVELLKTYIRLQNEENRHLEQALNLAIATQVDELIIK